MRRLPADVDGPVPEPAAVGIIDGAVMPAISRGRRGDDRPRRDACGRSRHDRGRPPSVVPDAAAPRPGPWHGPAWRPGPPKPQVRAIALRRAWPPHGMGRSARPSSIAPVHEQSGAWRNLLSPVSLDILWKNSLAVPEDKDRRPSGDDAWLPYAIYMIDLDGRVASWNSGAARLKAYSAEEIIGSGSRSSSSPRTRPAPAFDV